MANAQPTVQVRIMKYVGRYSPGDIVDLPQAEADVLCTPSMINDGNGLVEFVKAMRVVDYEEALAAEQAASQKILVVPTPEDPAYSAWLAKLADDTKNKKPATATLVDQPVVPEQTVETPDIHPPVAAPKMVRKAKPDAKE